MSRNTWGKVFVAAGCVFAVGTVLLLGESIRLAELNAVIAILNFLIAIFMLRKVAQ